MPETKEMSLSKHHSLFLVLFLFSSLYPAATSCNPSVAISVFITIKDINFRTISRTWKLSKILRCNLVYHLIHLSKKLEVAGGKYHLRIKNNF